MKKILFFIENNWIFGKIHNELIKALYPEIYCDILCWKTSYTLDTFKFLLDKYDYFFTTLNGAIVLKQSYDIPYEKMVVSLHGMLDITSSINKFINKEDVSLFKGYTAVSNHLINVSITHEIPRIPSLLNYGLFIENYKKNINLNNICLNKIGYTARLEVFYGNTDIKRGHLVKKVAELTNTEFVYKDEMVHFLSAELLYSNFDLLMFSSLTEGCQGPVLEAYASGIPVLGTHTGIFPELTDCGGGYILPFQEEEYVQQGVKVVNLLKKEKNFLNI